MTKTTNKNPILGVAFLCVSTICCPAVHGPHFCVTQNEVFFFAVPYCNDLPKDSPPICAISRKHPLPPAFRPNLLASASTSRASAASFLSSFSSLPKLLGAACEMEDVHPSVSRSSAASRPSRASDVLREVDSAQSEKPIRCAKFRQQELWAWKPIWSPRVIVIMYLIVSLIFIPIGVVVLIQSTRLASTARLRYDNNPQCDLGPIEPGLDIKKNCAIPVMIDKNITAPAYLYYGMVNFYQNARTYVSSRSDTQNRGEEGADTSECEPREFSEGETGDLLNPCGLVANSQFDDDLRLCNTPDCQQPITLNQTDISWEVDREKRFLENAERSDEENERVTSEPFMVWMRLSAYRNWKKLYARIEENVPAGMYYMNITASFPVGTFDGEKFFFISETTWFGGPNEALGIAYIAVGSAALVLAIGIAVRSKMADTVDLPPETTVRLDGIVADSELPRREHGRDAESA